MNLWHKQALFGFAVCTVAMVLPANTPIAEGTEVAIEELRIVGGPETEEAELSGLAWFDDRLVLLPQYPGRFATDEGGGVFVLTREEVSMAISGVEVEARTVPFIAEGLEDLVDGFEGFEAIAFEGAEVFVTVEQDLPSATRGYLLKGRVHPGLSAIELDVTNRVTLEPQSEIGNLAYEALSVHDGRVYVFYEANGAANAAPHAECFDTELERLPPLTLENLEYRITDTTSVDSRGRFWAANYYYGGDCWETESCPMRERFGVGRSHRGRRTVERLVELEVTGTGIRPTDAAPVELELAAGPGRNWEGIVRYGDEGFLVVTDKHPSSMVAFVPFVR